MSAHAPVTSSGPPTRLSTPPCTRPGKSGAFARATVCVDVCADMRADMCAGRALGVCGGGETQTAGICNPMVPDMPAHVSTLVSKHMAVPSSLHQHAGRDGPGHFVLQYYQQSSLLARLGGTPFSQF